MVRVNPSFDKLIILNFKEALVVAIRRPASTGRSPEGSCFQDSLPDLQQLPGSRRIETACPLLL